jgi:HK97 family phage major capsid protein
MSLSKQCVRAIFQLSDEAEKLARGSATDREQSRILLDRIKSIRETGVSPDEARAIKAELVADEVLPARKKAGEYRASFDKYLVGPGGETELRDFLAGTQSIVYTQGGGGGYLVPVEYDPVVYEAMAQVSPVLDDDVVGFTMTDSPTLKSSTVSGYDLSTISAQIIGEAAQETAQAVPTVAGGTLRSDIVFKISLAASMESEQDIPDFVAKTVRAAAVALARKIGKSVLQGHGGTDINGVTNNFTAANIIKNSTPGKIQNTDISQIFFSVDKFYRNQDRCGWLMDDASYKLCRNAVDSSNRPLLDFVNDKEQLLGKPVYICPDLLVVPGGISVGNVGSVLFGDLSHILVRASKPTLQRTTQQGINDITKGECLYVGRMRCDATLFDPSNGNTPPVVMAAWN